MPEFDARQLFDVSGRRALVTGGARGIGAAICRLLVSHGAVVMAADVDVDSAAQVAADLGCQSVRMDVASEDSVARAVRETVRNLGGIDILVNNAGINLAKERRTIEGFETDDWKRILSV